MVVLPFLMVAQAGLATTSTNVGADTGLDETAKQGYGALPTTTEPSLIIGKIVGTALSFLGVAFFCLLLYAGIGWMLSMGNEERIKQSKDMIIAAILGLIVVLGAYAITNLVARIFTETTTIPR